LSTSYNKVNNSFWFEQTLLHLMVIISDKILKMSIIISIIIFEKWKKIQNILGLTSFFLKLDIESITLLNAWHNWYSRECPVRISFWALIPTENVVEIYNFYLGLNKIVILCAWISYNKWENSRRYKKWCFYFLCLKYPCDA